jgi:hypothetical protein
MQSNFFDTLDTNTPAHKKLLYIELCVLECMFNIMVSIWSQIEYLLF